MRDTLLERSEAASASWEELDLAGLDSHSLLILQRPGDQTLLCDAPKAWRDPNELARAAIAEAERANRFVVIKPHPMSSDEIDLPARSPHHRVVTAFRCGADNDAQLAWLMAHADNAVMVNSTAHFQTLALGIPTACLGRGWFSENGVVRETADLRRALSVGRRPVEGALSLPHAEPTDADGALRRAHRGRRPDAVDRAVRLGGAAALPSHHRLLLVILLSSQPRAVSPLFLSPAIQNPCSSFPVRAR